MTRCSPTVRRDSDPKSPREEYTLRLPLRLAAKTTGSPNLKKAETQPPYFMCHIKCTCTPDVKDLDCPFHRSPFRIPIRVGGPAPITAEQLREWSTELFPDTVMGSGTAQELANRINKHFGG